MDPISSYADAISGIESGGRYGLLGPRTRGDRAYGKYQVMGANVPSWTQKYFGQSLTPKEFLNNPAAQDAVFQGRFGEYVQKYGPEGAARAWFAGEKGMNNPNAKDVLGTSVQGYGQRFMSNLGGAAPSPQDIYKSLGQQIQRQTPPTELGLVDTKPGAWPPIPASRPATVADMTPAQPVMTAQASPQANYPGSMIPGSSAPPLPAPVDVASNNVAPAQTAQATPQPIAGNPFAGLGGSIAPNPNAASTFGLLAGLGAEGGLLGQQQAPNPIAQVAATMPPPDTRSLQALLARDPIRGFYPGLSNIG